MKMNGAELITGLLERQGISILAGIPGSANLPLYHALGASSIRHVLARHEQGAAFIAQGMARSTGRPAVCLTTSGPGITNALTALADAKADSVPVIIISGQVPSSLIGTDAFQEVDACGMTMSMTKHTFLVRRGEDLLEIIPAAFSIALSGRPGPVLIDIPKDIQEREVCFDHWPMPGGKSRERGTADMKMIVRAAEMINTARRPVLCAGGGVIASGACDSLKFLAEKAAIPVATTLMGIGSLPRTHPLSLGLLGMHGSRQANSFIDCADLIIALGLRFNDRTTGKVSEFSPGAALLHIDIDRAELNKIRHADLSIPGNLSVILDQLIPLIDRKKPDAGTGCHLNSTQNEPLFSEKGFMNPSALIRAIAAIAGPDAIVTTDVGQHQMWVAQHYPFIRPRTFLTSGGLGTMGFGLPAAIGAALACPGRRVVCVSGDGSILMNLQELATLSELGLNVAVFIMNNGQLGLVRQQQELFYGKRFMASRFDCRPDFPALGTTFGIRGFSLRDAADPVSFIDNILSVNGPVLIDVPIHEAEMVFPMVRPGGANTDMIDGVAV